MFNLGAGEVMGILLLALIVLGPQRLPDAAKQVGKFMGEMRKLSTGFQNEIKTAFDEETEAAARKKGEAATAAPSTNGATPEVAAVPAPVDETVDSSADALAALTTPAQPGKTPAPREDVEPTPARPRRREPLRATATPAAAKPATAAAKRKPKPKPAPKR